MSSKSQLTSPNFQFLASIDPVLVELGARAEGYALEDPNTSMMKVRQLGELLAQFIGSKSGVLSSREKDQRSLIDELYRSTAITPDIKNLFHTVRMEGNDAIHALQGTEGQAITLLRHVRNIAVWTFRSYVNGNAKLGGFVPPVSTKDTGKEAMDELARLNELYQQSEAKRRKAEDKAADEAELRKMAEDDREKAFEDLDAALELAEENEDALAKQKEQAAKFSTQLETQAKTVKRTASEIKMQASHNEQVAKEELTEDDTRELIDVQLRAAGWMADSKKLRHSLGTRPVKGHSLAIAEWPTDSGPSDYVLFIGLIPVAVVEAKKLNVDVAGKLGQSQRYSETYQFSSDEIKPGGPWKHTDRTYQIPFLYSTNGRDYLKQIKTKSGIWFHDVRHSTNLPDAQDGWHSPTDLRQMLSVDINAAEKKLQTTDADYLPLRDYQQEALKAVEKALEKGHKEMLVAMATGTGKTRVCISMCYRLIKAKRFRRILFLVDRTSLGDQTADSLGDLKIDNNQTFADIYDVKQLGDVKPDDDTRFQIATIQSLVKRVLYEDGQEKPSVGQYDCIVVDECHRGYNLDQELSDTELTFRDETDYISKYSRVLDYFDAVKIGLTATPALHTNEIFGGPTGLPIYQYSYRQAVIEGYLVDHEPPLQIQTRLARDGIHYDVNDEIPVYNPKTQQQELFTTPDQINFDVESFNKRVINENFNRVVCEELVRHIDPTLQGKTLIFCVNNTHADMVVTELKSAFKNQYGEVENSAIEKITGSVDDPLGRIKHYKNEKMPNIVVTVDLLTTGIDVPEITNLVFLRRVKSRILYDQMIGRGTRLCKDLFGAGEDKTCFYIFDCVDMYSTLQNYTDMKPVVTRANLTFSQLVDELQTTGDAQAQKLIVDQLLAKLQRRKRRMHGERATEFEVRSGGTDAESLTQQIRKSTPAAVAEWFADKTSLVEFLDSKIESETPGVFLSGEEDEVVKVETGYGPNNQRPKDYLEEFRSYVTGNQDKIEAIKLCAQRPQELTRKSLRELELQLANKGYDKTRLQAAWRETTNADIAATIIGYIRHAILDTPIEPFEARIDRAMNTILNQQQWTNPQRKWLERIAKQFRENTLVDKESLDQGQFKQEGGGFIRLNKVFDGKIVNVLEEFTKEIWQVAA